MTELYKKYRPTTFKDVVGNRDALRTLAGFFKEKKVPHFLLLTGPSGCGKTTLARIIRHQLKCSDMDYRELNTADFGGIDMVRDLRSKVGLSPVNGETRVWLLDESHGLSSAAMQGLLKLLEDTPDHVYFILATTDPQKLIKTLMTRATEIKLKPLADKEMEELLGKVSANESIPLDESVRDKIINVAEGSPRKALVILDQIRNLPPEKQEEAVTWGYGGAEAIEVARGLLNPKMNWATMAGILKRIEGLPDQSESIRMLVLSYMASVAINNPRMADRAVEVIDCFSEPFFNNKHAGLVLACYESLK
jgi:DNA polymerase-3 subunit gamma/tau